MRDKYNSHGGHQLTGGVNANPQMT
jgi:hypothetical protein